MGEPKVTIGIPGFPAKFEWAPNDAERKAAWELYVELSTRAGVWQGVPPEEGSLRDLMVSLHNLFREVRGILRSHAEALCKPDAILGEIGISLLGGRLREFLTRWHPRLTDYEYARPVENSPIAWELMWTSRPSLYEEFDELRAELQLYAEGLKAIF